MHEDKAIRLAKVRMGRRIKIIRLPDIDLARNYPTIGRTGIVYMNVNELACCIHIQTLASRRFGQNSASVEAMLNQIHRILRLIKSMFRISRNANLKRDLLLK
jgi:hypothetical protein